MSSTITDYIAQEDYHKPVRLWLVACLIAVVLMVAIGGLTRLTESGLSITNWKPVTGILPPMSQEAWQETFEDYQQTPEYRHKNKGMTVAEFKEIFWLEYIHRVLGRSVGLLFFIPFIWFLVKKALTKKMIYGLAGVFLMGGAQGLVGWFMVKSGLRDLPYVSPLMLAFHLGMATLIFTLLLYYIFRLSPEHERQEQGRVWCYLLPVLIFVQMMLGALVAGLDAGMVYNSFPDMNGQFMPGEWLDLTPWYRNFVENAATVQWVHRMMAYVVSLYIIGFSVFFYKFQFTTRITNVIRLLIFILIVQFGLGVLTLLYQVPILLASLHQLVAFVLYGIGLWICFCLTCSKQS